MLTVQTMSGSVATDRTNGKSQSKYQGNTTGAQKSDAANGHAKEFPDQLWNLVRNQIAMRMPTKTARPVRI